MKSHWAAGNHKLRGKKVKLLRCGCCEVQNFTEDEKIKRAKKEIQDFKKDNGDETRDSNEIPNTH